MPTSLPLSGLGPNMILQILTWLVFSPDFGHQLCLAARVCKEWKQQHSAILQEHANLLFLLVQVNGEPGWRITPPFKVKLHRWWQWKRLYQRVQEHVGVDGHYNIFPSPALDNPPLVPDAMVGELGRQEDFGSICHLVYKVGPSEATVNTFGVFNVEIPLHFDFLDGHTELLDIARWWTWAQVSDYIVSIVVARCAALPFSSP